MYYVEIQDGIIVSKGYIAAEVALNEGQIEVSKEIYNQIGDYRATFETDAEGRIISVTPIPKPPEPPKESGLEEYLLDLYYRISMLELGL